MNQIFLIVLGVIFIVINTILFTGTSKDTKLIILGLMVLLTLAILSVSNNQEGFFGENASSENNSNGQGQVQIQPNTGQGQVQTNTGQGPGQANTGQGQVQTNTGQGQVQNQTNTGQGQVQNQTNTGQGQVQTNTGQGQVQNQTNTGEGQVQNQTNTGLNNSVKNNVLFSYNNSLQNLIETNNRNDTNRKLVKITLNKDLLDFVGNYTAKIFMMK